MTAAAGTEAEVECPGCHTTIRSRLGDQVVIAELRAQGWRPPPVEPDSDLVRTLAEELRSFKLRLGPNTLESIARGMRDLHLSGGERHQLAAHLAQFVDELVERRADRPGPGASLAPAQSGGN